MTFSVSGATVVVVASVVSGATVLVVVVLVVSGATVVVVASVFFVSARGVETGDDAIADEHATSTMVVRTTILAQYLVPIIPPSKDA
jgi:hypothetical protein